MRFLAILSYLGILCFVPLLKGRGDEFVYFHARQGLVLWIMGVFALFALAIPGIGRPLCHASLIIVLAFSVIGVISASLNRAWKLPLVHPISNHI